VKAVRDCSAKQHSALGEQLVWSPDSAGPFNSIWIVTAESVPSGSIGAHHGWSGSAADRVLDPLEGDRQHHGPVNHLVADLDPDHSSVLHGERVTRAFVQIVPLSFSTATAIGRIITSVMPP
jgi:hypothetical protein